MIIKIDKHIDNFLNLIGHIPFGQSGMFNSEIFMIYVLYKELECDMFIESGIDNGISTKKFLEFIKDEYIGIDINPNCYGNNFTNDNFYFTSADSTFLVPKIIDNRKNKNIFVMLDGPKNIDAAILKNKLLNYDNVKFVAIHDTWDGLDNENYLRIFETKSNLLFYQKYFDILNMKNEKNLTSIYNLINYDGKYYVDTYPNGPGISIYSKLNLKFEI